MLISPEPENCCQPSHFQPRVTPQSFLPRNQATICSILDLYHDLKLHRRSKLQFANQTSQEIMQFNSIRGLRERYTKSCEVHGKNNISSSDANTPNFSLAVKKRSRKKRNLWKNRFYDSPYHLILDFCSAFTIDSHTTY